MDKRLAERVLSKGSNPGIIASADIVDRLRYEGQRLLKTNANVAYLLAHAADTIERLRGER